MFDLRGYSERGMLNALFYDMRAGADDAERLARLQAFLSLCRFPCRDQPYPLRDVRFGGGRVRIEQTFSGFGDPDVLILLDEQGESIQGHSVFLEAKVKTAQRSVWSIREEWQRFRILRRLGSRSQTSSSNSTPRLASSIAFSCSSGFRQRPGQAQHSVTTQWSSVPRKNQLHTVRARGFSPSFRTPLKTLIFSSVR
jgi:hypothetical protein